MLNGNQPLALYVEANHQVSFLDLIDFSKYDWFESITSVQPSGNDFVFSYNTSSGIIRATTTGASFNTSVFHNPMYFNFSILIAGDKCILSQNDQDANVNTAGCAAMFNASIQALTLTVFKESTTLRAKSSDSAGEIYWNEPAVRESPLLLVPTIDYGSTFPLGATPVTYTIESGAPRPGRQFLGQADSSRVTYTFPVCFQWLAYINIFV